MVNAFEGPRLFYSHETMRLFDDADHRVIARGRLAEAAGIDFSEVITNRAEDYSLFDFADGIRETFNVNFRRAQQVKR